MADSEVSPREDRPASAHDDSGAGDSDDRSPDAHDDSGAGGYDRKRAALAVLPFLLLGLADVALLLGWGLNPLWGFMILPPILFISALAWLAFRSGFVDDRVDLTDSEAALEERPE
jgi:hypothetical protein